MTQTLVQRMHIRDPRYCDMQAISIGPIIGVLMVFPSSLRFGVKRMIAISQHDVSKMSAEGD